MDNKTILLESGKNYITKNEYDAFRVKSGTVLVYIVPVKNGKSGRKKLIYEAVEGDVIPSYVYKDLEYNSFRFCFSALESAKLDIMSNCSTNILREKFAKKIGLDISSASQFYEALAESYRMSSIAEIGAVKRKENNNQAVKKGIISSIKKAFKKNRKYYTIPNTENELYNAAALICEKENISIASYEDVKSYADNIIGIDDIANRSGFVYREISLNKNWHKEDMGSFIAFDKNGNPIACISKSARSYSFYNKEKNKFQKADKIFAETIEEKAYTLYRTLPPEKLNKSDIISFCLKSVQQSELVKLMLLSMVIAVIGLSLPVFSQFIYDELIPLEMKNNLLKIGFTLAAFAAASAALSLVKRFSLFRTTYKISLDFQNAVFHRLINLPQSFFDKNDTTKCAVGAFNSGALAETISGEIIYSAICIFFTVIYFISMITVSPVLSFTAIPAVLIYILLYFVFSKAFINEEKQIEKYETQNNSIIYQFILSISDIKNSEAKEKAILKYLKSYIEEANHREKASRLKGLSIAVTLAFNGLITLCFYTVCTVLKIDISAGSFIAFTALFGVFSAYITQIVNSMVNTKAQKPYIKRAKIILDESPENNKDKKVPRYLSGDININNLSFTYYGENDRALKNINLKIKSGEYIGIAGASGSGKSTLINLLLGFYDDCTGEIYYDNYNLKELNKQKLRKNMGIVLQNDSLIPDTILRNITVNSPDASINDVNIIMNELGLSEDIKKMPMGLYTLLNENSTTISEGQKQRILLCRALIPNPKIIILDESTSSLDNESQRLITNALKKRSATRITVAQRLNTLIDCDRIIVMKDGEISETGRYKDLINNKSGEFYKLAQNQIYDFDER